MKVVDNSCSFVVGGWLIIVSKLTPYEIQFLCNLIFVIYGKSWITIYRAVVRSYIRILLGKI